MAVEKTNPRLTTTDIVELIAKKSNLTKSQVRECLQEFAELYKSLMASDNTPSDFTMPLPYVGTFKLKKYKGMKKGSTYKIPDWDNGGSIIKVAEEDRPDFNLPVFVVKPEIREARKEASKRQWYREHKYG